MAELYVWWHADWARRDAAIESARRAQQQAQASAAGLTGRLLVRQEPDRGRLTLMETYAAAGGLQAHHRAALDSLAEQLRPWAVGGRHEEWFEAVA